MLGLVLPRAHGDHVDSLPHLLGGALARGEERFEAALQRRQVRAQERGLEAFEEVLHGEERLRLARAEPEARQLVDGGGAIGLHEPVAARLAIPLDGRVVAASHVLDVALEGGERDFELAQEVAHGHDAALPDEMVDLVEAFGAVHPELGPVDLSLVHRASFSGLPRISG